MRKFLATALVWWRRVFFIIAVYFVIVTLFLHFFKNNRSARPTVDPLQQNRAAIYRILNDQAANKTTQGKMNLVVFRFLNCLAVGEACTNNPSDADRNYPYSLYGHISQAMVLPYSHPPASGVMWAYDSMQKTGLVPKSYAAEGIGFGTLLPFAGIWKALRDIAYMVIVLVIITIGFMIMFRAKINPQTVISVESALPKIVIALLAITFSFPIAGFLIDLMYMSIALIVSFLAPIGHFPVNDYQRMYLSAGPQNIFYGVGRVNEIMLLGPIMLGNAILEIIPAFGGVIRYIGSFIGILVIFPLVYNISNKLLGFVPDAIKGFVVGGSGGVPLVASADAHVDIGRLLKALWDGGSARWLILISLLVGATFLMPIVIGLVVLLTQIFIFFRVFFLLLNSYVRVLMMIIVSPILLLGEAIPGQSAFTGWLKGLIAELIGFPLIVGVFLLGAIVIDNSASGTALEFPFLVGIDPKSFGFLIGMMILYLTPDFMKMVKQMIVPKPGPLDNLGGVGTFFGGATTGLSAGMGEISKYAGMGYYIKPLGDLMSRATGGLIKMPAGGEHNPTTAHP
ncbi:hypothetical protein HY214_02595 [Candidatus Roizmanbacteria bacterium]|nr:hypothetical protein [Candidatus Roizmanbacteria bacterium]